MNENLAPICYGAPTRYSSDCQQCVQCLFFSSCGVKVQASIQKISGIIDLEAVMRRHREVKEKKTVPPLRVDNGEVKTQLLTNKKKPRKPREDSMAKAILSPWYSVGSVPELRKTLAQGINPFPVMMKEQRFLTGALLKYGKVNCQQLQNIVKNISGDEVKAKATLGILSVAKILQEKEGEITFCKD